LGFRRNPLAMSGLGIVLLLVLMAVFAPLIADRQATTLQVLADRLQPASWQHLFGTDELGRDIFARVVFGSRITLTIVAMVGVIVVPVGLVIGLPAGYFGGVVDTVLMRITDIFLAFPRLVLALAVAAALGPGIENAVIAIAASAEPMLVVTSRRKKPADPRIGDNGVAVITIPDIRWQRCDIKSTNLLANVLAMQAASEAGCAEAILSQSDGSLTEGTHSSLFGVKTGTVLTAPNSSATSVATMATSAAAQQTSTSGRGSRSRMSRARSLPVAKVRRMARTCRKAAVRLAADASVAAEALENLKRLLERKQQLENQLPHLAADSRPTSASDDANASAPAPPQPLPPLPLPLHAEQDAAGGSAARTTVLPPPPRRRRRPPPERRVFDVRGFMAGFALSWAFGVVLYLFMTAG
jgi:hypothetical protein